jgi:hypothetical protein
MLLDSEAHFSTGKAWFLNLLKHLKETTIITENYIFGFYGNGGQRDVFLRTIMFFR